MVGSKMMDSKPCELPLVRRQAVDRSTVTDFGDELLLLLHYIYISSSKFYNLRQHDGIYRELIFIKNSNTKKVLAS
jgi:hypothetical protein